MIKQTSETFFSFCFFSQTSLDVVIDFIKFIMRVINELFFSLIKITENILFVILIFFLWEGVTTNSKILFLSFLFCLVA